MATWEDPAAEQPAVRMAQNWSVAVGLACVLILSAGTLAATRLPTARLPQAAREPAPAAQAVAGPLEASRAALSAAPSPAGRYVVVFGRFSDRAQAAALARRIRSKGYLADVVPGPGTFQVISRVYASVEAALFWTDVFGEIGLDAESLADLRDSGS